MGLAPSFEKLSSLFKVKEGFGVGKIWALIQATSYKNGEVVEAREKIT